MNTTESQFHSEILDDDEFDLSVFLDFGKTHWRGLFIALIISAGAGLGLSYLYAPIYHADAVLIASDDFGTGSQGSEGAGGFGGVAALIGISRPGSHQSEAIAILKSRALIESYVTDQNLMPVLFPKAWDPQKQAWRAADPKRIPTIGDAFALFSKGIVNVAEDKKVGLVTISVEWHDPVIAAQWTRDLVTRTNTLLRTRAIERGNRNLAYLNDELNKTAVVELRSAIYKLTETEIKKLMIAQGSEDYAFRYVDPPVVPEKRIFPKRRVFMLGGGFFGLIVTSIGMFLLERKRI